MNKNPPDVFARVIAVIGALLGIGGLWLSYHNYSWQQTIYQESLQERILVRLSSSRTFTPDKKHALEPFDPFAPKGKLGVEITNIGLHPIYLKGVTGDIGKEFDLTPPNVQILTFYEHDPIDAKAPLRKLEPDEAANFVQDVDFSQMPFSHDEKMLIRVETTTKTFSQRVELSLIIVSSDVPGWPMPKHKKK